MSEFMKLKQTRARVKGTLTRIGNGITQETSRAEAKVKMKKCEELWSSFEEIQQKIEDTTCTSEEDEREFELACQGERQHFESSYFQIVTKFQQILDEHEETRQNVITHLTAGTQNIIHTRENNSTRLPKLPAMKLPEFNGDFTKWILFKNVFEATIHNDTQLTNVQKHQYLIGALQGEARGIVEGFTVSEENYVNAWNLLVNMYDNQMMIVETHIEELFKFPAYSKDSKAESLRQLHWHIQTHVSSLMSMKQPVQHWDTVIIHHAKKKLDFIEQRDWQDKVKTCTPEKMPTLKEFLTFLTERFQSYMVLKHNKNVINKTYSKDRKPLNKVVMTVQAGCGFCGGDHNNFNCENFLKKSPDEKRQLLIEKRCCLNCMRPGHIAKYCRSSRCKKCNGTHNTLLHRDEKVSRSLESKIISSSNQSQAEVSQTTNVNVAVSTERVDSRTLLSTALIYLQKAGGMKMRCRALLDSGSQSNLLTENVFKKLNLPYDQKSTQIVGIDNAKVESGKTARVHISSLNGDFEISEEFLILPRITGQLPQTEVKLKKVALLNDLRLADPNFHQPGEVDVLLGAGIYWKVLVGQPMDGEMGQPVLQNTRLGWILGGEYHQRSLDTSTTCLKVTNEQLSQQIENFWKIEELSDKRNHTREEQKCEDFFKNTVTRDETGKFVVRLPLRSEVTLGSSMTQALKRLKSLERRFERQPELRHDYVEFMREYEELGHMTQMGDLEDGDSVNCYFIPHQAVLRPESTTTKTRVVFDASARTSNGMSLNDKLMTGPNLQGDLFHIVLRFRSHRFVVTADVEKMFRQVLIHPQDRPWQQILWREIPQLPIRVYQLNTVTYGTASAPYHAMKCLEELATLCEERYPAAARAIRRDFYMDDYLSGGNSLEEVKQQRREVQQALAEGHMFLRKWKTNDERVLEDLKYQREEVKSLVLDKTETSKTLGLFWNAVQDQLCFCVQQPSEAPESKREVASRIAQVFDPLGLVSPILIRGKLLMQRLWIDELNWDQPLSTEHHREWQNYHCSLEQLNQLAVQRNFNWENRSDKFDLFGFCDASERALGACVYAVFVSSSDECKSGLICARTRVAPLKTISLPRLELEAALILSKLVREVKLALKGKIEKVRLWSDSTIVLRWIQTEPRLLKTFVANRVTKIQLATEDATWRHVSSPENPADLLSRGTSTLEIMKSSLWWQGPYWLRRETPEPDHFDDSLQEETELPEMKKKTTVLLAVTLENLLHRFSSFQKLCRVVAYCQRFAFNCRQRNERRLNPLTPNEMRQAEVCVIRWTQEEAFAQLRRCLEQNRDLPKREKLKSLSPFLDADGLVRVGGRLKFSCLSSGQRHPAILPTNHHVTHLIMREEHQRLRHCSPEHLLHAVRQKFWPIGGRREARKVVRTCMKCFHFKPTTLDTYMGELPRDRVIPVPHPFATTGIDFAGPLYVKESHRRGRVCVTKAYVAVFVCFSTKAVHLELVSELTTEAFLAALQRFTARRGMCTKIFSDNGRNFVGAANMFEELQDFLAREETRITTYLSQQGVEWHFSPPLSPHFGGLWEAAVKVMKKHLYTETQGRKLTFEETYTLLCDIEAILNSRPLTPLPNDPNDLSVLTPAHFLIGDSLSQPVQADLSQTPDSHLSRWQHLKKMRQRLWQRWQLEYLQELQKRVKCGSNDRRIKLGDLVLLQENNTTPLEWPRARIIQVHPGKDGQIRVVTIKTATGVYTRSIKKICLLPMED